MYQLIEAHDSTGVHCVVQLIHLPGSIERRVQIRRPTCHGEDPVQASREQAPAAQTLTVMEPSAASGMLSRLLCAAAELTQILVVETGHAGREMLGIVGMDENARLEILPRRQRSLGTRRRTAEDPCV